MHRPRYEGLSDPNGILRQDGRAEYDAGASIEPQIGGGNRSGTWMVHKSEYSHRIRMAQRGGREYCAASRECHARGTSCQAAVE